MKRSKILAPVLVFLLGLAVYAPQRSNQDISDSSLIGSVSHDAGEFYRVGGQKIHLLRSLEKVAVRYMPDKGPEVRKRLDNRQAAKQRFLVDQELARERILILRTPGISSLGELADTISQFGQEPEVNQAMPVYINEKSGLEMIPTEKFIVKLAPGATLEHLEQMNQDPRVTIVKRLKGTTDQFILTLPNATTEEILTTCECYYQDPTVEWAEPEFLSQFVKKNSVSSELLSDQDQYPWHLQKINAPQAWATTTGSAQVIIAFIDDGVDLEHEDLRDNLPSNTGEICGNDVDDDKNGYIDDCYGWDFFNNDNDPSPYNAMDNHGTSVTGIAVAKGNYDPNVIGCAYGCRFMPLKVAEGPFSDSISLAEAIYYAAGFTENGKRWRGADVINFSVGFSEISVINEALSRAASEGRGGKGCPIFSAIGNVASGYAWYGLDTSSLPSGTYSIAFEYCKDSSGVEGEDGVWIGDVTLPDSMMTRVRFDSASMPNGWSGAGSPAFSIVNDPNHAFGTGRYVARSGKIGNSKSTYLMINSFQLKRGNPLLFFAWISSEKGSDDYPNYPPQGNDGDWLFVWFIRSDGQGFGAGMDAGVPGDRWYLSGNPVVTEILYPGNHASTIAVGASTDFDYRADYSQYGPGIDFVAPSDGGYKYIYTTDRTGEAGYVEGNYTPFGGTSAASPLASGVAALMLSKNPDLTADRVRTIMQQSCDKIGLVQYDVNGWNQYYGYGRINAKSAIDKLEPRPTAADISEFTAFNMPITINLQAIDDGQPDPPGVLTYIIDSLPTHGTLEDPGAGSITDPNTPLAGYGNQVVYTPDKDYIGQDSFTYKAYDGGTPPYGGYSNIATVSIITQGGTLVQCQVTSGYDDVYAWDNANQNVTFSYLKVGISSSTNPPFYMSGMRFTNVAIPQGARIVEAHLIIQSYNEHIDDPVYGKIEVQAVDNAPDLRDYDISNLTKTSASVNWDHDLPWSPDTWYVSPDIANAIQEIIDRPGWSEGNAISIFYSARIASGGYRYFSSYNRSKSQAPKLEVTYVEP